MRKFVIVIFLLSMLCLVSACAPSADYHRLTTSYDDLVEDYNELHLAYNNLVDERNALASQYNELLVAYNGLISKHNKLTVEFEQYSSEVEERSKLLEEFAQEIPKLLEGAIVPPYILVANREINIVFRNLDGNVEHWHQKAEGLEASVMSGWFLREVDISTLNYLGLHDIANRFSTGSKYVQLREQGRCLDYRPYIMADNFEPIALEFFSRHPDDESKIREVWNMVTQLNKYSTEITETPTLPLETL